MIQWCQYHKDDPPPPEDSDNKEKRTDDIPSWDVEFLKVDQGTLFELILVSVHHVIDAFGIQAANYLDIKGLLDVTCKTVANMIKGKSPEEIRRTFNIKNDFTPEEEEQVGCNCPFHSSCEHFRFARRTHGARIDRPVLGSASRTTSLIS